jgi:TonB-linked SusC/RagA family outer membrane protein
MTKKNALVYSFLAIFNNSKIALRLITMLLLFGTIQTYAASSMLSDGIVSADDLQQKRISGKVTDAGGNALTGVNIMEKGTINGAITDVNGGFTITVTSASPVLSFSFIGYTTQEVTVGTQTSINVVLAESMSTLDEIVVVGYSTQTRKSLTGAVSTVNAAALSEGTGANAITRLQGKASGVTIINSHVPGGGATISIRGLGTINNNNPLFVIDGVPTKSGTSQINPNEIESLTVLKDATSAAIYGARGANGVIIITTKRGSAGKTNVSFTARYGLSSFTKTYDLLNTAEYGEMLWLQAKNQGKVASNILYGSGATPTIPDYIVPAGKMEGDPLTLPALYNYNPGASFYNITKANKTGTDWYDAILQKAPMKEYNLALSGGGEKGTYAFNVGYSTEDGIVKYTSFDRYSIRSNADAKINKWLKVGESLGFTYSNGIGNRGDNGEGTPISQAYRMQPIVPVYDIQGNFAGTKATGTGNGENPLAVLYRDQDDFGKDIRAIGNAYAEVQLIKGLTFKTLFGFDYRVYNGRDIFRQNPEFQESKPTDQLTMSSNYTTQWNWANTLNYTKVFGNHTLNVLAGTEALAVDYFGFSAGRSTFASSDPLYMFLDAGEKDQTNAGSGSFSRTASYFGRVNYDYNGKYLVELTVRRDGSSMFGANNRWGTFPAASVGWRISEENFMAGVKSIIDNLKIRGGYGVSGNDELGGSYNGYSTYAVNSGSSFYSISGSATTADAGFYSNRIGNPDAKWETTATTNIGIDVAVLNNTLTATLDVWQRKTKDMLFRLAIPNVAGAATAPSVNIGNMDNKGFDLNLNYANKAMGGDLTYDLGLTLSHYKNEVVKISTKESEFINGATLRENVYTRATKGTSYPEFFGLIVDGYIADAAEAASYPAQYGTYNLPGHFKFRDVDGNGIVDNNDRTYIGSPHPKFTAGFNADLGYKAFNLSAFFYTSYGNKIANYVSRWIDYTNFTGNRTKDRLYKSWGSPYLTNNADAILPLADESNVSQYASTAFLEDGSFLRLKNLQLTYTLPKAVTQKLTVQGLQVYVQGTNLMTLTKYRGLDPEINASGVNLGIDQGQWPTARQIVFGIKLDL